MKKIIYLIFMVSILGLYSCRTPGKDETKDLQEKQVNTDELNVCDDFLTHYEESIDEYLKVIDDYLKNPSDEKLSNQCMEIIQEAHEWSSKWVNLSECADNEKYKQKFEKITKEVEKKLNELGL